MAWRLGLRAERSLLSRMGVAGNEEGKYFQFFSAQVDIFKSLLSGGTGGDHPSFLQNHFTHILAFFHLINDLKSFL